MLISAWIIFSFVIGFIARNNGQSFWLWTIISLIIDPVGGGLLYWLFIGRK